MFIFLDFRLKMRLIPLSLSSFIQDVVRIFIDLGLNEVTCAVKNQNIKQHVDFVVP